MNLEKALDVADQLIRQKTKIVILTGGEPVLYPGWEKIAARLAAGGVRVRLFTSGYPFDAETFELATMSGVSEYAVSLDGTKYFHDRLRPAADDSTLSSYDMAVRAIEFLSDQGANFRVVTQVNRLNLECLQDLYEILLGLGVTRWQTHLCQMTGRAGENREDLMCLPCGLEKIIRVLLRAAREKMIVAPLHCSVGYMTREEPILRGRQADKARPIWTGCRAGLRTMAITPSGGVKGCTTLPDEFITASLAEKPLDEIWANDECFPFTRQWSPDMLGGLCKTCAFARVCKAGCPAVAYSSTGSVGANPYCLKVVREKDD